MATDLIQLGSQWLNLQFDTYAAAPVTYTRGGAPVGSALVSTKGNSEHDGAGPDGIIVRYQALEWQFTATFLTLAGVQTYPKVGDLITAADGSVYEVANSGETCWSWLGGTKARLVVYTKQVTA
jgi:hypothetical protein